MSGVTHFERRDRQAFVHAECRFCGKKVKGTPKGLAGGRGDAWMQGWLNHIRDHMLDAPKDWGTSLDHLDAALRTAMSVAREYDRNK
jgi:hypothetical protein